MQKCILANFKNFLKNVAFHRTSKSLPPNNKNN